MSTNGNGKTERCRVTVPEIDPVTMKPTGQRKEYGHVDLPSDWMEPQKHSQLSAAQRAKLTDDMVAAIQEQRKQINALTHGVIRCEGVLLEHRAALKGHDENFAGVARSFHDASQAVCQMFYGRSFWGRLKWFWTGR